MNVLGRLSEVEQFEDIIVKAEDGRITRLADVARIELGGKSYDITSRMSMSSPGSWRIAWTTRRESASSS